MVQEVSQSLVLEGRVITVDALLTQRDVAQTALHGGGDYVMIVNSDRWGLQQVFQIERIVISSSLVTPLTPPLAYRGQIALDTGCYL